MKKLLFTFLLFLISLGILAGVEAGLRLFGYGQVIPLFIPTPSEDSPYLGIHPAIGKRYFPSGDFTPTPRKDLFLREKPENGYRIFVLGGSTTAGFPFGNNLTFPRILHRRLGDAFPNRHIEVVNTALTAVNSYTLLDFMDEILEHRPDALIIYAGHNEYYGALGVGSAESLGKQRWWVNTYLDLQELRLFQMMQDFVNLFSRDMSNGDTNSGLSDPMETQMVRIVGRKTIPYNSPLYQRGKRQFERNLQEIAAVARDAGIPVMIGELVSNVKDQPPFLSVPTDSFPGASDVYNRASLWQQKGRYAQVRSLYYRAKDLDALRFRAPEEFNNIIHRVAAKQGARVVPLRAVFERHSPGKLPGDNLMVDHLHPNREGYFLMADAFYKSMQEAGWIQSAWPDAKHNGSTRLNTEWGFTRLDSMYAELNILHLKGGWPFRDTGPNLALERFIPQTYIDSVALRIVKTHQLTLEMGHIQVANRYKRSGDIDRALAEYEALIYSVPFLDLFYEPALELLISHHRYEQALGMLRDAVKYNQSVFIRKWMGQMQLALNNTREGIAILKEVHKQEPEDPQVLFNLARAYYTTGRITAGENLRSELELRFPDSPYLDRLTMILQAGSP